MKVLDAREGDVVDLENDKWADDGSISEMFVYSYAEVLTVVRETEACVAITFDIDGFGYELEVGFPVDHELFDVGGDAAAG